MCVCSYLYTFSNIVTLALQDYAILVCNYLNTLFHRIHSYTTLHFNPNLAEFEMNCSVVYVIL